MSTISHLVLLWILISFLYASTSGLETINITIKPEVVVRQEDLVDCYERSDPTLKGDSQSVNVAISIMDIDQINEDYMEFRLHCWVTLHWKNARINLTLIKTSAPVILPHLLSSCMWKPDVIFLNTKEIISFVDTVPNTGYKVFPNGEFYRVQRFMLRVGCPMQFSLYPMDTQHCVIKVGLLTSSDEVVKLNWKKISERRNGVYFAYHIQPLQFYVEKPKPHYHTDSWYSGNYTELWANITFHRRLTGSFINFYLPSSLVVFLSWLSFYIDVEAAPARVSLGVTALLTITTQMVQARHILPPVQYVTGLDIWLFACLSQVFASFIEYSIAYSYRHRLKSNDKVKFPTKVFPKDRNSSANVAIKNEPTNPGTQVSLSMLTSCNPFDKHSRWIFPCFMITFTTIYWWYLLKKTEIFSYKKWSP